MLSAKKITLVPPEQSGGSTNLNGEIDNNNSGSVSIPTEKPEKMDRIKFKIYDKIHRFIKVILKLAQSNSYDENLRIKTKSGSYLDKSNIVDLLTHAMSPGKFLHGEDEFVNLLADSNVDPELIMNQNLKIKLINQINNYGRMSRPRRSEVDPELNTETQDVRKILQPRNKRSRKEVIVTSGDTPMEIYLDRPKAFKRKFFVSPEGEQDQSSDDESNKKPRLDFENDIVDDEMIDQAQWKI